MKAHKLPGFGSLGVEVTDLDLRTSDNTEIMQLGCLSLDQLLLVIRKEHVGVDLTRYNQICMSWATEIEGGGYEPAALAKKYGRHWWRVSDQMTPEDRVLLEEMYRTQLGVEKLRGMTRVTGIRDDQGRSTGMFADGELEWHSNNQGRTQRAPVVALLGWEGATGSRTEFLSTVDAYHSMTSEWQSMCDELIAVHQWTSGVMAPGLNELQQQILQLGMCPEDGTELPLVTTSPGGLKGLHFAFTTMDHFKGMSQAESAKVIASLKEMVIQEKYIYGHDWQDGDLLFFDNIVTLHRRPTIDCSKRLMYRMSFNYDRLLQWRAETQPVRQSVLPHNAAS